MKGAAMKEHQRKRKTRKQRQRRDVLIGCELTFAEAVEQVVKGIKTILGVTFYVGPEIATFPVDGITRFVCKGSGKTCPECRHRGGREDLIARWRKETPPGF
jgi:hypothetical protein